MGNDSAVFIFQMPASTLTTISNTRVILVNQTSPCNVFWQVGSSATLGTNSAFEGTILALASVTLTTGADLQGRALARTGAVTLDSNDVSFSCAPPVIPPTNQTNTTIPPTNQTNTTIDACYDWLKDIPAVCVGGTITVNTDLVTFDNCRHITCVNDTNTLEITACEKPDEINPTYFEMYRTEWTGTGIEVCLGDACLTNDGLSGFATQEFPVCIGDATSPIPPETPPPSEACFSQLQDIPASCAGAITQDSASGACRTVSCSSSVGSVDVLSCEKTDSSGTYFEMYRQSWTGLPPRLCLGNDCLQPGWGYERGDYFPVCIGTTTPVNETAQTTTLSIAPWFPQGGNYVFICNAGFTATSYDWTYGDGSKLLDYSQNNVYHSYASGNYDVTCTAKNAQTSSTGTLTITV